MVYFLIFIWIVGTLLLAVYCDFLRAELRRVERLRDHYAESSAIQDRIILKAFRALDSAHKALAAADDYIKNHKDEGATSCSRGK